MATRQVPEDIPAWIKGQVKYVEYDPELNEWFREHDVRTPRLTTIKGQILALVTDKKNENTLFDRDMMDGFLNKIGMKSKDVIQAVNKTDQWGLVHRTKDFKQTTYYYIPRPFEYTNIHIKKRQTFGEGLSSEEKNEKINKTKGWIKKYYLDVPNEKWELGHVDPNGSNSNKNLVMQPPIQKAYRDRFKFDDNGLRLCPTMQEVIANFSKYYTEEEKEQLMDAMNNMRL